MIVRRNNGGAFVLKDVQGTLLARNVPISHLKTIGGQEDPANNVFHIEAIVDHRINNNTMQYRVRWHGYSEHEDTWERADAFSSPEPIHKYWRRRSTLEGNNVSKHLNNYK